jgi:hypothetical protein
MKKNSSKRGYLSQLAQPLLPGEPLLKARHIAPAAEIERTTVPVIEDRFEIARYARRNRPVPSPAESQASNLNTISAPPTKTQEQSFVAEGQRTMLPVRSSASSEGADASRDSTSDLAHAREEILAEPPRSAAQYAPVGELHVPPIVVTNETPEGAVSSHRQGMSEFTSTGPSASAAAENPFRAVADPGSVDVNAPATAAGTAKLVRSNKDHINDPDEAKRLPAKEAFVSKPSAEGRRVHIGTVEIRAVLPQPPAPPVPPRPTSEPMVSRGRSSADEPLGRGLAWSYGLVQE